MRDVARIRGRSDDLARSLHEQMETDPEIAACMHNRQAVRHYISVHLVTVVSPVNVVSGGKQAASCPPS